MQTYTGGNWMQINVPDNWKAFESQTSVQFAPEGAYGDSGITHGAIVGIAQNSNRNLGQATEQYISSVLQDNNYLRQNAGYTRTTIAGRQAFSTVLSGRSPVTNRTETATVFTTQLSNGSLLYIIAIAPENESGSYNTAFRNMIRSIRLNDRQ